MIDLTHMPEGCGTWPAFWTVTADQWPQGGEIDIIEGVNDQGNNLVSLHSTALCSQPAQGRDMGGFPTSLDCDVNSNYNQGELLC